MNWGDPRLPQRFWDKVHPEPNSGCWIWTAASSWGYGQFGWKRDGEQILVRPHRLTVALVVDLPSNMTVDHRCENTLCVNPHHCLVVSHVTNAKLFWARHPERSAGSPGAVGRPRRRAA